MKTGLNKFGMGFISNKISKMKNPVFDGIVAILENGKISNDIGPNSEIGETYRIEMHDSIWPRTYKILVYGNRYVVLGSGGLLLNRIKFDLTTRDRHKLHQCRDRCLVT